jgi:hypothetical protein
MIMRKLFDNISPESNALLWHVEKFLTLTYLLTDSKKNSIISFLHEFETIKLAFTISDWKNSVARSI